VREAEHVEQDFLLVRLLRPAADAPPVLVDPLPDGEQLRYGSR